MTPAVVLFDGVCHLCNRSVDFVLRHDHRGLFRVASVQSPAAQALLGQLGWTGGRMESILLIEENRVFSQSDAVLRILRGLGWPWAAFYSATVVPRFIRDPVYRWIARNRYRWFGQRDTCRVPTPGERPRFFG